jgi:hypothetical protein
MGIISANENSVNTADKILNTIFSTRKRLYGGTKRRKILKNSFIEDVIILHRKSTHYRRHILISPAEQIFQAKNLIIIKKDREKFLLIGEK